MGGGSSSSISSAIYAGLSPADQDETQNMMNFVQSVVTNDRLLSTIDVHCCGDLWLLPTGWHTCKTDLNERGRCPETYGGAFDLPLSMKWGEAITDAIAEVRGNEFVYGPIGTVIYTAAGSGLDWMYEKFGTVFLGSPEIHRDSSSTGGISTFYPNNGAIQPSVQEVYAGMVAGVQFALDNANERISDIVSFPIPEPGYPLDYICDNVLIEGLCNLDCASIDTFPFDLNPDETPVVEGTGVDPCGAYLQSFENGTATYVSIVPGTSFSDICPDQCPLSPTPAVTPGPTSSPTNTVTPEPTSMPVITSAPTSSPTKAVTPEPTITPVVTSAPTRSPTNAVTPEPTITRAITPVPTRSPVKTVSPEPTITPAPTAPTTASPGSKSAKVGKSSKSKSSKTSKSKVGKSSMELV